MPAAYSPTTEHELYPNGTNPIYISGYKDGDLVWLSLSQTSSGASTVNGQRISAIESDITVIEGEIDVLQEGGVATPIERKSYFSTTRAIDYRDSFLLKTGGNIDADISHITAGPQNFYFIGSGSAIPHDPEVAHFYRSHDLYGQIVWWLDEQTNMRHYAKCVAGATLLQKQTLPPDADGGWVLGLLEEL